MIKDSQRRQDIKRMGFVFVGLALCSVLVALFIPLQDPEGVVVLAILFLVLGLYCCGACAR